MSYSGLDGGNCKFLDMETRKGFVKKVYGILAVQLLITFAMTLLPVYNLDAQIWIR